MSVEAHKLLEYVSPQFMVTCDQIKKFQRAIEAHRERIAEIERDIADLQSRILDESGVLKEYYNRATNDLYDAAEIAIRAMEETNKMK